MGSIWKKREFENEKQRTAIGESQYAIEVRQADVEVKGYALRGLDFKVPKGTITGLIGRNGSGKTTLIETLADSLLHCKGDILYWGLPMENNEKFVKGNMAVVHDMPPFSANAYTVDIVKAFYRAFDDFSLESFEGLRQRLQIGEHNYFGNLSKGTKAKFALALALARSPKLLIMDEPTDGLDAVARIELLSVLQEFMEEDEERTVLFSTHITTDLEKVADHILLMADGAVVMAGDKDELMDEWALATVEKAEFRGEVTSLLMGAKVGKNAVRGLCRERRRLDGVAGVTMERPTLDDFIKFSGSRGIAGGADVPKGRGDAEDAVVSPQKVRRLKKGE